MTLELPAGLSFLGVGVGGDVTLELPEGLSFLGGWRVGGDVENMSEEGSGRWGE